MKSPSHPTSHVLVISGYMSLVRCLHNIAATVTMVYLSTVEEWQKQSSLLLQARPATVRSALKYIRILQR